MQHVVFRHNDKGLVAGREGGQDWVVVESLKAPVVLRVCCTLTEKHHHVHDYTTHIHVYLCADIDKGVYHVQRGYYIACTGLALAAECQYCASKTPAHCRVEVIIVRAL